MTEGKNFTNELTPHIVDTEYVGCNFTQKVPGEDAGKKVGKRIFPGDDTPRTFRHCNLINCIPPPGSTLDHSASPIVEYDVVLSTDTVTIDGDPLTVETKGTRRHGHYDPATQEHVYLPTPEDKEVRS